ncbi:hypothetical protein MYX82_00275 [Acidobacteria bacterium AH-259-D05]|nr:hypothetical protein [Acidobacteria bacterium AH-259-D05]
MQLSSIQWQHFYLNQAYRLKKTEVIIGRLKVKAPRQYDCITIIDVLYLLSPDEKLRMLTECSNALNRGGLLLLKETDDHPRWKFWLSMMQELLAVKVVDLTYGLVS